MHHTYRSAATPNSYAMTGWRLGYAMLPSMEETLVFRQLNINIIPCTLPFIQEAGREALDNPENLKIIASMTAEFKKMAGRGGGRTQPDRRDPLPEA